MIDCLLSRQKDRLNAERLVHLPAVHTCQPFLNGIISMIVTRK